MKRCVRRRLPARGTTVFQDLAALDGLRRHQRQSIQAVKEEFDYGLVELTLGIGKTAQPEWITRAIELMADALFTPAQWWEYHRADVEAAVKRVVEGMRKDG